MSEPTTSRESCTCERCVAACKRKPGSMLPGDAERIAAFLGVTVDELFATSLVVDSVFDWNRDERLRFPLPAFKGVEPGTTVETWQGGRCVFLKRGRCSIHAVKPFECARSWCGDGPIDRDKAEFLIAGREWERPEHSAQLDAWLALAVDSVTEASGEHAPGPQNDSSLIAPTGHQQETGT